MKPVREVVSRDVIEDLWGAGYTILPRNRHPDPFFVSPEVIPQGRAYQWWHLVHDQIHFQSSDGALSMGWAPVPASRHDGYFMPAGHVGYIEVNGLGLFEKPKFEVDAERAKQVDAVHQQTQSWFDKTGAEFFGGVKIGQHAVGVGDQDMASKFVTPGKTIETTVAIPKDMIPHMAAIFEERDRLAAAHIASLNESDLHYCKQFADWMEEHPDDPQWPALHAILLPRAIENVRKALTEEKTS